MRIIVALLIALLLPSTLEAQRKVTIVRDTVLLFNPTDSTVISAKVERYQIRGTLPDLFNANPVVEFWPNRIYAKWWDETMECSGLHMTAEQINRIRWFAVDADGFGFWEDGEWFPALPNFYIGYTFVEWNRIWIIKNLVGVKRLIRHEMLHVLMFINGRPAGHENQYFINCKL